MSHQKSPRDTSEEKDREDQVRDKHLGQPDQSEAQPQEPENPPTDPGEVNNPGRGGG